MQSHSLYDHATEEQRKDPKIIAAKRAAEDKKAFDSLVEAHAELLKKSSSFTYSDFASQVKSGKISDFAGLLRYVAGKPYSRTAKLFVETYYGDEQTWWGSYFPGFVQSMVRITQERSSFTLKDSIAAYINNPFGSYNPFTLYHLYKLKSPQALQRKFLKKVHTGEIKNSFDQFAFYYPNIDYGQGDEGIFLKEFLIQHEKDFIKSGFLSRSPFVDLFWDGGIKNLNDLIKYVAAKPHSRSAKIFARMTPPVNYAYVAFIQKHLLSCQASYTSYLGSFFVNTSKMLTEITRGKIDSFHDVKVFAVTHPESRTAKLKP